VAIAFHKWADALSMGCHYRSKNISLKLAYSLIIGQAVLNIVAIGLGWIISTSGDVVDAIFLSLSAGTFLAISTLEMLGEQLHDRKYMWIKFGLLVGATGFVVSIWYVENKLF
jgi:zinc transporter ZupT